MFKVQFSIPEQIKPFYYNGIKTRYLVSNYGYIINGETNKIIHPKISKSGYLNIHLSEKKIGLNKHYRLHRLIAEVFLPNPMNKDQVNHINGCKKSNMSFNLEWCTAKENMEHAKLNKLVSHGEKSHLAKYSDKTIHEICKMLVNGFTPKEISEKLNVPNHLVRRLRRKDCRKDIVDQYDLTFIPKDQLINENNPSCKYSDNDILEVLKLLYKGYKVKEISYITHISEYEIRRIKNGKIRKSLIEKFKFND